MTIETNSPSRLIAGQRKESIVRTRALLIGERLMLFGILTVDLLGTFVNEMEKSKWEEEVYGFDTNDIAPNPFILKVFMALMRAHQVHNPSKFYNVLAPGSVSQASSDQTPPPTRKPDFVLSNIPDLGSSELPELFLKAIKSAQEEGTFWTVGIQLSNIVARILQLPPEQILKKTMEAVHSSYKQPNNEINFDYSGNDRTLDILRQCTPTVLRHVLSFCLGGTIDNYTDWWGFIHEINKLPPWMI